MAVLRKSGLLALGAFATTTFADDSTVWSSVVFARTGEYNPLSNSPRPNQLTPNGAKQLYNLGAVLRGNYLSNEVIPGLSTNYLDPSQLYVLASGDAPFAPASAQALMQGLYPPVSSTTDQHDPLSLTANGTYSSSPLGNYQYPMIVAPSNNDQEIVYTNGAAYCDTFNDYYNNYQAAAMSSSTSASTQNLYTQVGKALGDDYFPEEEYGYWNAPAVSQYVSYLYNHNKDAYNKLSSGKLAEMDALNQLRYLSDGYLWNVYGNLATTETSTSPIAGQSLAMIVLEQFMLNIGTAGATNKLSILVGDYAPLISFFALANLNAVDSTFTGMPEYGSAAIFELLGPATMKGQYPDPADMSIRFYFRNGTSTQSNLNQYPIFSTQGSGDELLSWNAFAKRMSSVSIGTLTEWCTACNAWSDNPFCMFYNTTATDAAFGILASPSALSASSLDPALAGAIGACITLGVLGLIVVTAIACGGLRFTFGRQGAREGMGGFKGSQKMASDADLTTVKGGVGVQVDDQGTKERVGSWELKNQTQANKVLGIDGSLQPPAPTRPMSVASSIRRSFDVHDPTHNPFQDPVKPREHV